MKDKDFLMDVLEMEKNMAVDMTYALNETSNENLYKKLFKMFENISQTARNLFNFAYNENFYTLSKEDQNKITETLYTFKQELKIED